LAYRLVRFNRIDAIDFNEHQIIELGEKIAKRLEKNKVGKKEPTGQNKAGLIIPDNNKRTEPTILRHFIN